MPEKTKKTETTKEVEKVEIKELAGLKFDYRSLINLENSTGKGIDAVLAEMEGNPSITMITHLLAASNNCSFNEAVDLVNDLLTKTGDDGESMYSLEDIIYIVVEAIQDSVLVKNMNRAGKKTK